MRDRWSACGEARMARRSQAHWTSGSKGAGASWLAERSEAGEAQSGSDVGRNTQGGEEVGCVRKQLNRLGVLQ